MEESNLTEKTYIQKLAQQTVSKDIIVPGLAIDLLDDSENIEKIDDILENLKNSMLSLIDTTENPKTVTNEQIIGTMLFQNIVFNTPDFVSRLMYSVLMQLTRDFANQTKQFFMPVEILSLNFAWICFLHTNLNANDTAQAFNPSMDLTFELPFFISKSDQKKIKELISKFSSFKEEKIKFLSFSPYNSFDYNDFSFENTPGIDNGDTFLLSLVSLLYYYRLMIAKEKEKKEVKDELKEELKEEIKNNEERIDEYINYLDDFTKSLPNAADILNAFEPSKK